MEVSKNISILTDVPPRKMTLESMQKDFDYEISQNNGTEQAEILSVLRRFNGKMT